MKTYVVTPINEGSQHMFYGQNKQKAIKTNQKKKKEKKKEKEKKALLVLLIRIQIVLPSLFGI